jgi:4-hydroxyacetophenone monooxygenase
MSINRVDCPDDETIRRALAHADPNALRLTLHHLTGNPLLADMRVETSPVWAGALFTYTLAEVHHDAVRQLAFEYLKANWGKVDESAFSDRAGIRQTMELFGHGPLSEHEFAFGVEEAAFDEFPRGVEWHSRPSQDVLDNIHIIIVGAGISGIAAAVHLERLGLRYTIIERQHGLGGTWHFNNYPEARVDSSSLIYQYKFEKKYPWKQFFATAHDTREYLEHVARKFGVADKIVFDTEVMSGDWDDVHSVWRLGVRTNGGETQTIEAHFVISASGLFSTPKLPDIPGIETFKGSVCHTTNWNDNLNIAGKRICQIGTGASGAQLMPWLARQADHLTVFQRTANWVLPMEGYKADITPEMHWLSQHFPLYWNWFSYGMYFLNAQLEGLQEFDADWQQAGGTISKRNDGLRETAMSHIRTVFAERPDLIEKATPKYPPLARRPTVDNGWYDALLQDNVALVTDGIVRATETGLITADGTEHPCDILVCAAGFQTTRYLFPALYTGRDGATFDALWSKDGPRAYLGITAPGFPNFFMCFGPNSQARAGSFYTMSEAWSRYALKAIVKVIESGARTIEVRPESFEAYNVRLDAENKRITWETFGKGFYYLTDEGRSVVNSPWRGAYYHALLREPDFGDYLIACGPVN